MTSKIEKIVTVGICFALAIFSFFIEWLLDNSTSNLNAEVTFTKEIVIDNTNTVSKTLTNEIIAADITQTKKPMVSAKSKTSKAKLTSSKNNTKIETSSTWQPDSNKQTKEVEIQRVSPSGFSINLVSLSNQAKLVLGIGNKGSGKILSETTVYKANDGIWKSIRGCSIKKQECHISNIKTEVFYEVNYTIETTSGSFYAYTSFRG